MQHALSAAERSHITPPTNNLSTSYQFTRYAFYIRRAERMAWDGRIGTQFTPEPLTRCGGLL